MTSGDDRSAALRESLRQVQRGVWGVLVVCAVVSFTQDGVDPEPAPHPRATTTAIGLAFVAIISRLVGDSPRGGVRLRVAAALVSWTAAASIGFVGVWLAVDQGAVRTGMAFAAGGLFLALRGLPVFAQPAAPR